MALPPPTPPGPSSADDPRASDALLVRGLGTWDGALLTIGSIVGTGIFITTGGHGEAAPARRPDPSRLAGRRPADAGRRAHLRPARRDVPARRRPASYVKEAYGPLWGFLYGWTAFLVIMSGGIATLGVAFGEYLGSFLPLLLHPAHPAQRSARLLDLEALRRPDRGGARRILVLTAVNHFGLKEGAWTQNALR